jgi:hypothetical protein
VNKTSWQRLTLSLIGILVIVLKWRWSTAHLYTIPEVALAPFASITVNSDYVIAAIVIFMVTGRLVYDWSNKTQAVSEVMSQVSSLKENITETRDERIIQQFANEYRDDPSYAPIKPDVEEPFR